ncbi:hypothetical protein F4780DRAFT_652258 [Xylariomycetidae sp. FL0641]|nr:hypothetical protein F4780DRAFT_652258 [Xylariomycetidae sp. FL0641]
MTGKTKSNPLNGSLHTAGIFCDMSVDGPEIGTLVLIVDRAKNLPNRKTIGKQDPYCAARLGKEAKKTTTDIRGGQTPKWDQELRFTVHDSPDYYQLKLSVFNDDKKTDLIGETWIDLRDIVVQGGGQSDQWHTLHCKGKYAGEVRIEITYYDSRPKPEKPAAKPKPVAYGSDSDLPPAGHRAPVKRRPLPSDPVTGQAPSPSVPDHAPTPPRPQPNPPTAFIPNQSPLQAVEYGTPPLNRYSSQQDLHYAPALERHERFPNFDQDPFHSADSVYPEAYDSDPRVHYNVPAGYDPHMPPAQLPPPPPAHRIRHSTGNSHDVVPRGATLPMRHDVLRSEAHRQSVSSLTSSYPGRPTYRPYDSAPDVQSGPSYQEMDGSHPPPPRHYSYDIAYDSHHRSSMQPTVEDVPESWTPPTARSRRNSSRARHYDEPGYGQVVPSPAPLNLRGRASFYSTSPSPMAPADYSQAMTPVSRPYRSHADSYSTRPSEMESNHGHSASVPALPPVPATLVPGIDPLVAREISERFHEERQLERRYTQSDLVGIPPRGRQQGSPPSQYAAHHPPLGHRPTNSRSFDRSLIGYPGAPNTPTGPARPPTRQRVSPSPSGRPTIRRKSVSPAPPHPPESRRLSGVPFGPDSYDALNPSIASSKEDSSKEYTNADGKIVTADGREVDPSDHLPMESWAPEPEPKKPTTSPDTRSRPSPVGAQPMPPSGRRQLRVAPRPQSMAGLPTHPIPMDLVPSPTSTGRNRLQKKMHRVSAQAAPSSAGASPLGPATPHKRNSTPPRALVRASTFDYENYDSPFNAGPGGARAGYGSGPPIPAKVPMMSGGLGPSGESPRGGEEWALMQEMSRIDIGTGRARRHGGY